MEPPSRSAGSDSEGSKRKRRAIAHGQKACNPCRLRKVRCSYQHPCQTCIDRQHPELCLYDSPLKRVNIEPPPAQLSPPIQAEAWQPSRREWDALSGKIDRLEAILEALRADVARQPATETRNISGDGDGREGEDERDTAMSPETAPISGEGQMREIHATHPVTGEAVFLGANSVPAMAIALSQANDSVAVRELLSKSILPIFTLENDSLTYPFVDLWGLPHASPERIEKLCGLLPSDSDCLLYLRNYRDTAHVLFPAIVNMQQFEGEVVRFLRARATLSADPKGAQLTDKNVYGSSVNWLGLFFACRASGCQCSKMQRRERQLTSQVYVCCAYECLRILNYLSCAQLHDIQSLLVLGNVLSNNMNAGVAWALLGLTIRLAQAMGLHHSAPHDTALEDSNLRCEVWTRIVWQDSLLSISYDRATATTMMTRRETLHATGPLRFSYEECMLQLCTTALDVVFSRNESTIHQDEPARIEDRRQKVLAISHQACSHLKELAACVSMKDHLQYWNWHMHRSYVISELCRPVMTSRAKARHDETVRTLQNLCIAALTDTVDAFLNLHDLTAFARSSWVAVHRSLSSALLLGILKEPRRSERVWVLLNRLIAVMSSLDDSDSDALEMPAPITRAVAALQQLNVREDSANAETSPQAAITSGSSSSDDCSPHTQMHYILWGASPQAASSS